MMGGAMVQLAFNLGNAVGAYFGGLSIEHGAGLESTALIGSFLLCWGRQYSWFSIIWCLNLSGSYFKKGK